MHLAGLEIISKRVNPSAPSNLCCAALWLEATQDPHWAYGGSLETLRCPRQSRVRTRLIPPPLGVVSYPRHTEGWRLGCTCYLQMTLPAAVFVWSTVLLKKKKSPNSIRMSSGGLQVPFHITVTMSLYVIMALSTLWLLCTLTCPAVRRT